MKAVIANMRKAEHQLRLVELMEPALPSQEWCRISVHCGGICGSDVKAFRPRSTIIESDHPPVSVDLSSLISDTAIPGHEIVGSIIEVGNQADLNLGMRVVLDPVIPCAARGLIPCKHCTIGDYPQCLMQSSGHLVKGKAIGFTNSIGGGWAEQVLAHPSMIHVVPSELPDETALLAEPLSITLTGLRYIPAKQINTVLIIGAGTIGLLAAFAIGRVLKPLRTAILSRYKHQATQAEHFGVDTILSSQGDEIVSRAAHYLGASILGYADSAMIWDGFDLVVDAVGTALTLNLALKLVNVHGTILTLGTPGIETLDLHPLWLKQVTLVGSLEHSADLRHQFSSPPMQSGHTLAEAISLLRDMPNLGYMMVTHKFHLADFEEALDLASAHNIGRSLKVALIP
jgi:L-iditol 2-dehydrogenase